MMTENQKGLTQNRSLFHRAFDTLDTTATQNPKGTYKLSTHVSLYYLFVFQFSAVDYL